MTNTVADTDCGDIDLTTVRLSRGAHGATFTGACCVIEKSNRLAACRVDLKAKYGADPFSDDHHSIDRGIRRGGGKAAQPFALARIG